MGFISSEKPGYVESIVFFLSDSLRSAVEAGDSLQHSPCELPQLAPEMDCSAIASKLAGFRRHVAELRSRELIMLTKILRARDLAKDLRVYAPAIRPEIDTFRLATVMASDLRDMLIPVKDSAFGDAAQPRSFLDSRGYPPVETGIVTAPLPGYRIAGKLDVRLLIDACEALHFSLASRYGFEAPALASYAAIEDDQQVFIVAEQDGEEPFLLSDLGEMIPDNGTPMRPLDFIRNDANRLVH